MEDAFYLLKRGKAEKPFNLKGCTINIKFLKLSPYLTQIQSQIQFQISILDFNFNFKFKFKFPALFQRNKKLSISKVDKKLNKQILLFSRHLKIAISMKQIVPNVQKGKGTDKHSSRLKAKVQVYGLFFSYHPIKKKN